MLSSQVETALNRQINHELAAALNYMAMTAFFEQTNLAGFAHFMLLQYEEELQHARRLFTYLLDRGGTVDLSAVEKPKADYNSTAEVFQTALQQEEANTAAINELYALAREVNDFATLSHLQWFLDEQVEEEKLMGETLALVELVGDDKGALLVLNQQLGARTSEEG